MLLSHAELLTLIDQGVITANPDNINAASIDITMGNMILVESAPGWRGVVDPTDKKDGLVMTEKHINHGDIHVLGPGEFILAQSVEVFNLPNDISAEYKLKSSMARCGLEHLNAGWCDAGWNGSVLTLELKNMTRYHSIQLKAGMKIGQIVFFRHAPVPDHASYAAKGRYNGDQTVTASKGIV